MRLICSECGAEIPSGSDFCYRCGAMAKNPLRYDEEDDVVISNYCFKCGAAIGKDDQYCMKCGASLSSSPLSAPTRREPMTWRSILAILLALIPGFFDIFGLGQLVQKRWGKAFIYISMTLILFYVEPAFLASKSATTLLMCLRLMIFIFQAMDVFKGNNRRASDGLD